MAIQDLRQTASISKEDWALGVWELHRQTGAMVGPPESFRVGSHQKRLFCRWDDAIAPVPLDQEIADAAAARNAEAQTADNNADSARTMLLNNAALIREAMIGISEARGALDSRIPIDTTNQQTIINSILQRQAAVFFLSANALRAVMVLAARGRLPDEIVEAFLKT